jgi:hypothetical protein
MFKVASRIDYGYIVQLSLYHGAGADSDANHAVTEDLTPLDLASPDSQREGYHIVQLLLHRVVDVSAEDVICNSLLFLPYYPATAPYSLVSFVYNMRMKLCFGQKQNTNL